MSSANLKNNELEFTPTFGTQLFTINCNTISGGKMDQQLFSKEKYLLGTCWKLANKFKLPAIVIRIAFILAPFLLKGLLGSRFRLLGYILLTAGVYLITTVFLNDKKKKIVEISPLVPKREWAVHIFSSYPIIAMIGLTVGFIQTKTHNEMLFESEIETPELLMIWLFILIIPSIALIGGVAKRVLQSTIMPPEKTVLIVAHLILLISFFLPWCAASWYEGRVVSYYPLYKTPVAPFFICLVLYSAVHSISKVRKFIGYRIVLPLMIVIGIATLNSIIKETS